MTSTLKATIGIAGATAIGGGATAIYLISNNTKAVKQTNTNIQDTTPSKTKSEENNPKKVTALLEKAGLTILDDNDSTGWKANWDKFLADHNGIEPRDDWAFTNWNQIKIKTDDTSDLKSKCNTNSKKEATDEDSMLFKAVKKYCTSSTEQI